jgi:DNA-binding SARP family transcriptional activator
VIQTLVYRLRAAFADVPGVRLVTAGSGYLLAADPMLIDVHRFRAYTERARASDDAAQRASLLTVALGLWRGPALAGAAPPGIRDRLCGGLEEARLVATEDRVDAELTLGRHDALLEELIGLVRSHPSRERLVAGLMLALYRSGRAAAALELCRMTRLRLADELGLDPGPRLQELERAILRNDPGLDWRAAGPLAP